MSVVLTFSVPADRVSLGRAARTADVSVTLDPLVPLEAGLPSFRVTADSTASFDAFETELRGFDALDSVEVVDSFENERLYAASWTDHPADLFGDLRDAGAHVLSAEGDGETWRFEARFRDDDDLAAFSDHCRTADVPVEITSVRRDDRARRDSFGLTDNQRDTLLAALDAGFYDVPRETTTVQLADALDISDQSLSERLRRAHATLVENALR